MREERGQATVMLLGLALLAFAVAGLAVDGTRAFIHRMSLQNAADAAARAGASEIDAAAYYRSGGRRVTLDPEGATATAVRFLDYRRLGAADAGVSVENGGVYVTIRSEVTTSFLGLVGIGSIPVAVESRAEPVAGDAP